jgi:hypothetical protein
MCNVFPQAQFVNRDKCWRGGPPVVVRAKGERPQPLTPNWAAAFMTLVTPLANEDKREYGHGSDQQEGD